MIYIQRKGYACPPQLETVDECKGWAEARHLVAEYTLSDPSAEYYTSSRACKNWSD